MRFLGIHIRAISQRVLNLVFYILSFKITLLKLPLNLPGENDLTQCSLITICINSILFKTVLGNLFSAKSLPELMLTFCLLNTQKFWNFKFWKNSNQSINNSSKSYVCKMLYAKSSLNGLLKFWQISLCIVLKWVNKLTDWCWISITDGKIKAPFSKISVDQNQFKPLA